MKTLAQIKRLMPKPTVADYVVMSADDAEATIAQMYKLVKNRGKSQVAKVANEIGRGWLYAETCKSIHTWIRKELKYREDAAWKEQLKAPSRLIRDGYGDCDDFSILAASILERFKIPYSFVLVDWDGSGWQHVLVIAYIKEKDKTTGVYIDGVNAKFNELKGYERLKVIPKGQGLGRLGSERKDKAYWLRQKAAKLKAEAELMLVQADYFTYLYEQLDVTERYAERWVEYPATVPSWSSEFTASELKKCKGFVDKIGRAYKKIADYV